MKAKSTSYLGLEEKCCRERIKQGRGEKEKIRVDWPGDPENPLPIFLCYGCKSENLPRHRIGAVGAVSFLIFVKANFLICPEKCDLHVITEDLFFSSRADARSDSNPSAAIKPRELNIHILIHFVWMSVWKLAHFDLNSTYSTDLIWNATVQFSRKERTWTQE